MTAGKGIARSYLAQLAEPVQQGEPVFTTRSGAPPRAKGLPVEAPVIEDVIESSGGPSSRTSPVVRRKAVSSSARAMKVVEAVQTTDGGSAGFGRDAGFGQQRVKAVIQPRETARGQEDGGLPNATVVQPARGSSHINRETTPDDADRRNAEPIDSNAENRYERLKGSQVASKPKIGDVFSDAGDSNEGAATEARFIKPAQSTRDSIGQPADDELARIELEVRPAVRSSVQAEAERNSVRTDTSSADESSRNARTLPREFARGADNRKAGVSVRIGTIEVRASTPAPQLVPAASQALTEAQSKPAESHLGPRPTSRDSAGLD
jgi:hypothetical protein